ncbi:MAG: HAD family hydrolase [Fimbriimonadia bacterium]|nr:HAD family hydrolase [Fimbriimonadia bacterium]
MPIPRPIDVEKIKAVAFDLDDTLCAYMESAIRARREAFQKLVLPHTPETDLMTVDRVYKRAFWEMMDACQSEPWRSRYLKSGEPSRTETMRRMLLALGIENPNLAYEVSMAYAEARDDYLRLFEDALPVLQALKTRFPLGLITNGPAEEQRREIAVLGIEPFFDVVMIEGEFGIGKPDPRIFHSLSAHLQKYSEEILFVGNSWNHDIAGALAAGFQAAWINRENEPPPEGSEQALVISGLNELTDRLL